MKILGVIIFFYIQALVCADTKQSTQSISGDEGCCTKDIKIVGAEPNHTINGLYKYQGPGKLLGFPRYKILERNYTLELIKQKIAKTAAYAVMDPSGNILAHPKDFQPEVSCAEDLSGKWVFPQDNKKVSTLELSCVSGEDPGQCCPVKTVQGGSNSSLDGIYRLVKTMKSPPESFCRDGCVYQKDGLHYCFADEDNGYTVEACETGVAEMLLSKHYVAGAGIPNPGHEYPDQPRTQLHAYGQCRWRGSAIACHGYCEDYEIKIKEAKCGDGLCCTSGSKYYCCHITDIRTAKGDNSWLIKKFVHSWTSQPNHKCDC